MIKPPTHADLLAVLFASVVLSVSASMMLFFGSTNEHNELMDYLARDFVYGLGQLIGGIL